MKTLKITLLGLPLFAILLSACNFPLNGPITPTPNVTQAYGTIQAEILTRQPIETAAALGTIIPTQITPVPPSQLPTFQALTTIPTNPAPTAVCDRIQPGNPIDVTITDDSIIPPGEVFVKTWRLLNAGACSWNTNYSMVWFSGEQFADSRSYPLDHVVQPGNTIDLSIEMTAPLKAGTYQSNWKLQNSSGYLFGIGPTGNSPFWVRIIVPNVVTPTITSTVTLTKTPSIQNISNIILADGEATANFSLQKPELSAIGNVKFSSSIEIPPSYTDCSKIALPITSISVDPSPTGSYYCFISSTNNIGWIQILGFNSDNKLSIKQLTWSN